MSIGLGTISGYKFYFQGGRLYSAADIFFARIPDQKRFTMALMNVLQRKWGPIRDSQNIEWKNGDYQRIKMKYYKGQWEMEFHRIMVFTKGCGFLTRGWSTDRWEIGMAMPKKSGGKASGGGK